MGILAWIVLGLIAGLVASLLVGGRGYGITGDIIVGIAGAFFGGWLGSTIMGLDVTGINFTSVFLAVGGAVIVLLFFRGVPSGRSRA